MKTKPHYRSLRFKITAGVLLTLVVVSAVTSYLRYVSYRRFLIESVGPSSAITEESIQAQLAAYLGSRALLSLGSVLVISLMVNLMMTRIIVGRLRQFLRVVKRIGSGDLDARMTMPRCFASAGGHDEITELAEAFNRMADGLKEKEKLERKIQERMQQIQVQAEELSTLNALATTVTQSLDLKEVLRYALDEVLELMRLRAGWITLSDGQGETFRMVASRGLPEDVALAHAQCAWNQSMCAQAFESGWSQIFRGEPEYPCPAAEYLREEGLVFRACVPLRSKDLVLGVMSLTGVASTDAWILTDESSEMLTSIGRQIGIAIENASLYEELRKEEMLRRQLLEREITLQEEERKRIARELHDQTSQRLTSILMTLGVLGEAKSLATVRAYVQDLRGTVAQTLEDVHNLALELRPSVLDDLGLLAALRQYFGEFRDIFSMPVDFQVLGLTDALNSRDERLSSEVETALYRIVQEALMNVARHAQAHNVSVLLEKRDTSAILIVEDDGKGFDVAQVMGSHVHEGNLGLYGMRERASLLSGTLTIESTPGTGTTIFVELPLESERKRL